MAGGGQASSGAIPPIVMRVGKEVVTVNDGDDSITQVDEDETAALATPGGPGEFIASTIPPVAWS